LAKDTLMLFGSYKNDLKTRIFFKNWIGQHFHFTARGIDWLKSRWLSGNPPTYLEFSEFWQEDYLRSQLEGNPNPKIELRYNNFTKEKVKEGILDKKEIVKLWKLKKEEAKNKVYCFLKEHNFL
jgi:hypothetical protein